jgi:hypothetical protein
VTARETVREGEGCVWRGRDGERERGKRKRTREGKIGASVSKIGKREAGTLSFIA